MGVWTSLTGVTPAKRERCYSAIAYYRPNAERKNLILFTGALTQEILLKKDGSEWVAKGVRFSHGGRDHSIQAGAEIIVCGGSISSPQILELSGIGDPSVLAAAGVDCKVANPYVGENLQDHLMTAMIYEISPNIVTPEDLRADPVMASIADKEYALHASGPRTAIPSSVSYLPFTWFVSPEKLNELAAPLIAQEKGEKSAYLEHDRTILERLTSPQNIGQIEYNFDVSNYNPHFKSESGKKYATMLMMLQYPFSRGSVHLPPTLKRKEKKADAEDKPVIDPKYFAGQNGAIDLELMEESQHFGDRICQTSPLSDIIVKRAFPPAATGDPVSTNGTHTNGTNGDAITTSDPREDFRPWIRDTLMHDWHPVGTCSMGASVSMGAVVDDRLRVYGVRGLRVCDASIMPLQISAHLQATVYAIGEKGADLIKEDWQRSKS